MCTLAPAGARCLKLQYNAQRAGRENSQLPKVTALRRLQLGSSSASEALPLDAVTRILPHLPYLHTLAQRPYDPDAMPALGASMAAAEAQQGYHLEWHLPASMLEDAEDEEEEWSGSEPDSYDDHEEELDDPEYYEFDDYDGGYY